MKYCPGCGMENDDMAVSCSMCGTMLPSSGMTGSKVGKRGGSGGGNGKKLLLIGGCAVLAVGLVAALIVLVSGIFPGNALENASQKTLESFSEQIGKQNGVAAYTDAVQDHLDDGEYTMNLTYGSNGFTIGLDCDYSRKSKLMSGSIDYHDEAQLLDLSFDYSLKKDTFQFAYPAVMEDVYGFSLKKIGKKLDNSAILSMLQVELPEIGDLDFFKKTDMQDFLNQQSEGGLEKLKESVEITYLDERTLELSGRTEKCKMYQVTWSATAMDSLLKSLGGDGPMSELAGFVKEYLPEIEPDCRCYVNSDGYLVAIDMVSMGNKYVFLLQGTQNPWDKFTLEVTSLYGESKVYNGGLYSGDSGIQLYLRNEDEIFLGIEYDDNGDFSVYTEKHGTMLQGNIDVTATGAALDLTLNSEQIGPQHLQYSLSELEQTPQQLSKYYVDLLDMNLSDWQRLLLDLGVSLS